jgi:hypothetical protein
MKITNHWLWPTLVVEGNIDVPDVVSFNVNILKVIKTAQGVNIWDLDTPEINHLKESFLEASNHWLVTAKLDHLFVPRLTDGWLNVYQPGQFIPPHYHGNTELVNLYYVTDEDENNPLQLMPHYTQMNAMASKPGHTGFADPRGGIDLKETPPVAEFCPKQGRMLTWPGHLQHWTMPTNRLRIIIGAHSTLDKI